MLIKSIRWRLLLWLTFLLVCTLSGFALASYEAHRMKQFQQVDEELSGRFEPLAWRARGRMFGGGPGGRFPFGDRNRRDPSDPRGDGPAPRDDFPPPRPGDDFGLGGPDNRRRFGPPSAAGTNSLSAPPGHFEGPVGQPFGRGVRDEDWSGDYFVIWNYDGTRSDASTNAPPEVPRPAQHRPADTGPYFRTRGVYREAYDYNREGRCVLLGRSIEPELANLRGFAFILVGAGLAVLGLGLGGGWLIVSRAIRPVETIGATARRIADGNLAERINVTDTESELGQLAGTLNSTFARLEASFAQQKQFTADASHELRTPIAVIISEAQTTLARERTSREYRETIEACLDTAQQMRRLTESLLELANLDASQQATQREPIDLADVARQRVEFIHPLADQRGLKLVCKFAPAKTSGNADHLGLVINNLLSNAIHYNQPNGEITITTGTEANHAFVRVSDTGVGISPADLPLIFDRFYRADKSRSRAEGRSGLGLAICKAIVEAHGGGIEVASDLGVGTTFTVRLPV